MPAQRKRPGRIARFLAGAFLVAATSVSCKTPGEGPTAPPAPPAAEPTPLLSAQAPSATEKAHEKAWIATWVSAQQVTEPRNLPPPPGLADSTLRQIVQTSLGGDRIRVTFSNHFGDAPLQISSATVAPSAGGATIVKAGARALTFGGAGSVTVAAGEATTSDAVELSVGTFENLAVSMHLTAPLPSLVTGHPGSRTTSFIVPKSAVHAETLEQATPVDRWYFLSAVEVQTAQRARAVVVIGDSITDGRGSTTNKNDRWPNHLARRLQANPSTADVAVLNQGIGGNRVLRAGLGPSLLSRLERDVFELAGVRWLVVFAGINDLGTAAEARKKGEAGATARDLISAYQTIIAEAHQRDIQVLGATLMPYEGSFYFSAQGEADRQTVNEWIRSSGAFDGVIDFDAITRDATVPTQLAPHVDGGDHLHPSAAGYATMAEAIELSLFDQ